MTSENNSLEKTITTNDSVSDVPVEMGGRAVTAFNTAGVSVSLERPAEKIDTEIKELDLAHKKRGFQVFRMRNRGPRG